MDNNRNLHIFFSFLNFSLLFVGIVPSALGLGIGKFRGIGSDIGDFSVGFFD